MLRRFLAVVCVLYVLLSASTTTLSRILIGAAAPAAAILVSSCISNYDVEQDTTGTGGEDDGCPSGPPI